MGAASHRAGDTRTGTAKEGDVDGRRELGIRNPKARTKAKRTAKRAGTAQQMVVTTEVDFDFCISDEAFR